MATKNLGKVAFVFKGDYSNLTLYQKYDVVFDGESSFISTANDNSGKALSDTNYWKYLCRGNYSTLNSHISNTNNPHTVTKAQVGLGNADNTSDADKPISSATQTALNLKENTANKGAVNGYASLDETGKVPTGQLPSYVDDVLEYANLASFPVSGIQGKIYVALDTNKIYRWSGSAYIYITSGAVDSVAGKTGAVSLVKGDVGLGNVDNTSDANKPISTAQQTALNLKADKAIQVIAGSGLTGGGTLESDRTINVTATDDSITVAADGIKVDTQNSLTSTSATKPLAANQGKILNDSLVQLGADLNTSVADEKSMFPAIAYNKRVLADGGTVISKQSVIDGYKTMIDLLPNTKLLFCPNAGVKTRVSGIYSYLTKAYDMGVNGFDLTQATEANQPYLSGNIAPNENKYLKSNINSVAKTINHTEVSFLSTDSFSFILSVKPNTVGINQKINISSNSYITINSNGLTLYNGTSNILSTNSILEVGKNSIVEFKYSNGTGLIKINGIPVTTTVISGAISFDRISTQATYFDSCIYYAQIFNKYLSEFESKNTYSYLRSQYPEIEGVNIGNQHWATSNYECVVTGNGTVIPEVQSASTAVAPNLIINGGFDADTNWIKDVGITIFEGNLIFSNASFNFGAYQNVLKQYKAYSITFDLLSITGKITVWCGASQNSLTNTQFDTTGTKTIVIQNSGATSGNIVIGSAQAGTNAIIDNVSVKEVGWADLTTPAWCYYNNDPVLGSVYGKLYNYYAVQEIAKNPPKGWRVPSSADFVQLSTFLGGNSIAGGKLKKEGFIYWNSPNTGATNESGFSAIPSGGRSSSGSFVSINTYNYLRTSDPYRFFVKHDNSQASVEDLAGAPTSGTSIRLVRTSPVGDQTQNISTGVFTTNIAAGTANKDLSIPFGYEVKAINVLATTAITNFKCDLYSTSGVFQQNLVTGKSASANVPIKFGVSADANIQYTDPILRFNCTGNSGSGMEIIVVLNKIL